MDIQLIANIVYGVSLALIALFALIGFFKGVWKTGIALLIQGVLMIVAVFAAPAIGKAIGSINLASIIGEQTIAIGSSSVAITSIRQTISDVLTASGLISPVTGQTIYQAALAVTDILLSLISYIVMSLLFVILSWLLSLLLYHTLFKWFIPKTLRTKHKVRWGGAIAGAVMGFLATTMVISPVSSIVGVVKDNENAITNLHDKKYLPDSIYGVSDDLTGSLYGDHWLGGFDTALLNAATTTDFNNTTVNASDLLNLISGISGPFTNALNSADAADRFNYTILMAPDATVNAILDTLIGSNLLIGIMPAICEVAVNLASSDSLDLSGLSFADIDFKSDLTAVKDAYGALYATGAMDNISDPSQIVFTQDDKENVIKALKELGGLDLINTNMPTIMVPIAKIVQQSTGYAILSQDESVYTGLDWGEELSLLADVCFRIADLVGVDFSYDEFSDLDGLMEKVKDSIRQPNGVNKLNDILVGTPTEKGLLDMGLLSRSNTMVDWKQVTELLFNKVPTLNEYIDKSQVTEVLNSLDQNALKNEVSTIVSILPNLLTVADESEKATGDTANLKIDLANKVQMDALKDAVGKAGNSKIIQAILPLALNKTLPAILESSLGEPSFMGLAATSFDLSGGSTFFTDLQNFISIAPDIANIADVFSSDKTTKEKLEALDTSGFERILSTFVNSNVLNPVRIVAGQEVENTNLQVLLNSAIKEFGLDKYGFKLQTDMSAIDWDKECANLTNVLATLKDNLDLFSPDGNDIDIANISADTLENLVISVSNSELLEPSLSNFLQTQVAENIDFFGVHLDFESITDWVEAAHCLGDIWDLSYPWRADRDSIDYKKVNFSYINALITSIRQSGFVPETYFEDGTYSDQFGTLIFNLAKASGILEDLGIAPDPELFSSIDVVTGSNVGWNWIEETKTIEVQFDKDSTPIEAVITSKGEIFNLCNVLDQIVGLDFNNFTASVDKDMVYNLLCALDDSNIGHKLIAPALRYVFSQIKPLHIQDNITIDVSECDPEALMALDENHRREEFKEIAKIYEYLTAEDGQYISDLFTLDNLTNINTDSPFTYVDETTGETRHYTNRDILKDILDYAASSDMFNQTSYGHTYTFASGVFAGAYTLSDITQLQNGYRTGSIDPDMESALFTMTRRGFMGLDFQQRITEAELVLQLIDSIQSTDDFKLQDLLDDPSDYITKDNIDRICEFLGQFMKTMSHSYIVYRAPSMLEEQLFTDSGLLERIARTNTDVEDYAVALNIYNSDYHRGEMDEQIDNFTALFKALFELLPDGSKLFNAFLNIDFETMLLETPAAFLNFTNQMAKVDALSSVRAWLIRGELNTKISLGGLELNKTYLEALKYVGPFNETSDPEKINTIEYYFFLKGVSSEEDFLKMLDIPTIPQP